MTEKPISFSVWKMSRILAMPMEDEMRHQLRAVKLGEMSTMRPIKHQPLLDADRAAVSGGVVSFYRGDMRYLDYDQRSPYQPGDILWIREAWRTERRYLDLAPRDLPAMARIWYVVADSELGTWADVHSGPGHYRPGTHLPKRFARPNRYEVTAVEVRQPQGLTDAEMIAEGIRINAQMYSSYKMEWAERWSKIYGEKSWDANPWCWRYTFRELP